MGKISLLLQDSGLIHVHPTLFKHNIGPAQMLPPGSPPRFFTTANPPPSLPRPLSLCFCYDSWARLHQRRLLHPHGHMAGLTPLTRGLVDILGPSRRVGCKLPGRGCPRPFLTCALSQAAGTSHLPHPQWLQAVTGLSRWIDAFRPQRPPLAPWVWCQPKGEGRWQLTPPALA